MSNIHLLEVVVIHQNNQKLLNVKIYLNSYRHPANMTDHGTSTQLSQWTMKMTNCQFHLLLILNVGCISLGPTTIVPWRYQLICVKGYSQGSWPWWQLVMGPRFSRFFSRIFFYSYGINWLWEYDDFSSLNKEKEYENKTSSYW